MPDNPQEAGELTLRFPVFAIVCPAGEEDGLLVLEADGKECIPLFLSRELAELYAEQVQEADAGSLFRLRELRGDEELDHLLAQLPAAVAHVVWDTTLRPQAFRMTAVADLRRVVGGGS
jgi:hypothetical protein